MRDLVGMWALWYGNEQKVGFAEKKLRLWLKMAHRVYQGCHIPTCGFLPRPTLYEALFECGEVGGGNAFWAFKKKGARGGFGDLGKNCYLCGGYLMMNIDLGVEY